jgi:hypothetical protein
MHVVTALSTHYQQIGVQLAAFLDQHAARCHDGCQAKLGQSLKRSWVRAAARVAIGAFVVDARRKSVDHFRGRHPCNSRAARPVLRADDHGRFAVHAARGGLRPAPADLSCVRRKKGPRSCVLAVQVEGGNPGRAATVRNLALGSSQKPRGRALTILN